MIMKYVRRRLFALGAGVAVVAGALASGTAVAAPAAPQVSAWAAGIAHPATPHCPAGTTPLNPVGAARTPHGGTTYTFDVAGHKGFETVPPQGFDPRSAGNAVLREMNLPTRPASGSALTSWLKDMASYKSLSTPALCQGAPVTRPQPKPAGFPKATHVAYTNWAGYIDTSRTYSGVVSHWTQNYAHTCNCTGPTDEVTWVGLGGVNGGLVQAGTRLYSNTTPYAWWEYVGADGSGVSIQSAGTVGVGDDIAAAVSWNSAHTVATFGVTDNGSYRINFSMSLSSTFYDGSTAEFINERPAYCSTGCYKTLTNFVQTNFSQARVILSGSSTQYAFTAQPYEGAVATNDGNFYSPPCSTSTHLLMYPENASGYNFDLVWCRAS